MTQTNERAPRMPRWVTVSCPRCSDEIELSVDYAVRLTFGASGGHKGWITATAGLSGIEHVCRDAR